MKGKSAKLLIHFVEGRESRIVPKNYKPKWHEGLVRGAEIHLYRHRDTHRWETTWYRDEQLKEFAKSNKWIIE